MDRSGGHPLIAQRSRSHPKRIEATIGVFFRPLGQRPYRRLITRIDADVNRFSQTSSAGIRTCILLRTESIHPQTKRQREPRLKGRITSMRSAVRSFRDHDSKVEQQIIPWARPCGHVRTQRQFAEVDDRRGRHTSEPPRLRGAWRCWRTVLPIVVDGVSGRPRRRHIAFLRFPLSFWPDLSVFFPWRAATTTANDVPRCPVLIEEMIRFQSRRRQRRFPAIPNFQLT